MKAWPLQTDPEQLEKVASAGITILKGALV